MQLSDSALTTALSYLLRSELPVIFRAKSAAHLEFDFADKAEKLFSTNHKAALQDYLQLVMRLVLYALVTPSSKLPEAL